MLQTKPNSGTGTLEQFTVVDFCQNHYEKYMEHLQARLKLSLSGRQALFRFRPPVAHYIGTP